MTEWLKPLECSRLNAKNRVQAGEECRCSVSISKWHRYNVVIVFLSANPKYLVRAVLSIFFLNSKKYKTMLQDSFSEQPDLPTSLLCFILFTGYLLSWGSTTNCLCFALSSFLIRLPSTFQNRFTFTFLPGSSALLQTPECSEYHPSEVLWSALFLLPGSSYLEPTPCFCPPFYLCQLF